MKQKQTEDAEMMIRTLREKAGVIRSILVQIGSPQEVIPPTLFCILSEAILNGSSKKQFMALVQELADSLVWPVP